jgi:ElaB/YqjD/DUF883 family membrane-anchored ribosome-binding protein
MTTLNSTTSAKRDLHVGGVGSYRGSAPATLAPTDPLTEASETLLRKATEFAQSAGGYVRDNPWAAIGAVGLLGLAAGYVLSRRI